MTRPNRRTSGARRGAARKALRSHRLILKTVEARQPDAAEAAMREHLDEVEDLYWQSRKATAPT